MLSPVAKDHHPFGAAERGEGQRDPRDERFKTRFGHTHGKPRTLVQGRLAREHRADVAVRPDSDQHQLEADRSWPPADVLELTLVFDRALLVTALTEDAPAELDLDTRAPRADRAAIP